MDVLVIEDDPTIAEPLASGLRRRGYGAVVVGTGAAALAADGYDVVLLDLGLPDMDGYDVCRQLRSVSDVPIIVVTARGDETDRVIGLELGADDYIVKPFGFRELVARIRAVTRRVQPRADEGKRRIAGPLHLDPRTRRVHLDGREIELTPKEFDVLAMLMDEPGVVVSRRRLAEQVWESAWYSHSRTLDVHVGALRRKLGDPAWIETVRGIGFRLGRPT
ncbi:MAG TPA: response regulator transcription factor [Euzebyales bacterium]|nr:response regulator transcription factor [Euzebyales bacterium]